MAAGEAENPAVARGIAYLIESQDRDGEWNEPWYTAVGFPRVFYLRYHGYRAFFPLWALARFRTLSDGKLALDSFWSLRRRERFLSQGGHPSSGLQARVSEV